MPAIDESELSPAERIQLDSFRTMIGVMPTPAIRLLRAFLAQAIEERGESVEEPDGE